MTTSTWFSIGTGLQGLGLALIIGGMLALGAFTAPVLFKQFARPEAGEAMTLIFRRYDTVLLIALSFVWLGEAARVFLSGTALLPEGPLGWLHWLRWGVLGSLTLLMALALFVINPKIEAFQQHDIAHSQSTEELLAFRKAHTQSEQSYKLALLLAVLLVLMTPFVASTKY